MNSEQTMIFNENQCQMILPGMVDSIGCLIECSESTTGNFRRDGFIISAIVIGTHVAELLLKYKLEREGKPFEWTHDLYDLYKSLRDESKVEIQKEFDKIISVENITTLGVFDDWDRVETVFKNARNAHKEWRYIIETNPKQSRQSPEINIGCLYAAVLSVFRTVSLTTFETTAVEDMPDPDARA